MPCDQDDELEIVQGSYKQLALFVTNVDTGAPYDLTSPVQVWLTLKARAGDTVPLILKRTANAGGSLQQVAVISPQSTPANTGRAYVYLLPTDTASLRVGDTYWLDAWVVNPSTGEHRQVVKTTRVKITQRVTVLPPLP